MSLFQWLTIVPLAALLLWDLLRLAADSRGRPLRLFRAITWTAAALAIYNPQLTARAANLLGIQRGADLVFYTFVLASLVVSFYFYARFVRLERQLTEIVRHLALLQAQRGKES
jgi:hypothetical protein